MASTVPFYDVAVVGAGAYGTAVLGQISLRKIPDDGQPNFRVLVVERGQDLGPGMPYSKYMTIPEHIVNCLLYTSPSPRDGLLSRMPSSA